MSQMRPEVRTLEHRENVTVTCSICKKEATVTMRQRNNAKFTGIWCDGEYKARHVVCPMLGPEGERWA